MARIAIRPAQLVDLEREGDRSAGVAHGRADPPRAEVEAEDGGHEGKRLRNQRYPAFKKNNDLREG